MTPENEEAPTEEMSIQSGARSETEHMIARPDLNPDVQQTISKIDHLLKLWYGNLDDYHNPEYPHTPRTKLAAVKLKTKVTELENLKFRLLEGYTVLTNSETTQNHSRLIVDRVEEISREPL